MASLETLVQDVQFAVRLLRRDPRYAITVVLVLALGIGVNNMLFTILNAHTIRGLPMNRADRVAFISTFDDRIADRGVSYTLFNDLDQHAQSFTLVAAFSNTPMVISGDGHAADRLAGAFVSLTAFRMIGSQPILGRDFTAEDDRAGAIVCTKLWDWKFPAGPEGIRTTDPQSLLIVAAVLAFVAAIASIAPARRAARLDPLIAIRHE